MNKPNISKKPLRGVLSVCAVAALAAAMLLATAGIASANGYQGQALYQIALSAGDLGAGPHGVGPGSGGGFWLWIALYPDGTGDYAGSDCLAGAGHYGFQGAYSDRGDVSWVYSNCTLHSVPSYSGQCITISGVNFEGLNLALEGSPYPTPWNPIITIPANYGHYTGVIGAFIALPDAFSSGGSSVLQVAP